MRAVPARVDENEVARSKREHRAIARVLRTGLYIASVLLLVGAVLGLRRGPMVPAPAPLFHIFEARDPGLIVAALGVLALALTPLVRVVALAVFWARDRDMRFALVALCVLATIALSIALEHG